MYLRTSTDVYELNNLLLIAIAAWHLFFDLLLRLQFVNLY